MVTSLAITLFCNLVFQPTARISWRRLCCIPYVWIYLTCFVCLAACAILIAVTIEYNIDVGKAKTQTTTTAIAPSNASYAPGSNLDGSNIEVSIIAILSSKLNVGSGCASDGRAAASDTRDPRYESRHWRNFIYQLYIRKDKNKEKEAGNGPSFF